MIIRKPSLLQHQGFAIFFDNVRVDQFVKDYSVQLGLNGTVGSATINMIYVPEFDKVTRDPKKIQSIKDQTEKEKATNPPPPVTTTKKVKYAKVVNCYHLTVRKGPSMSHGPLAWVDAGNELEYLGKGGNNNYWVKVKVSNGTGWVGGKYVKIIEKTITTKSTSKSSTPSTSGDGGRPGVVSNCHALVVRSSPNYGKNEIGWIHPEFRKFGDHKVTAYETKSGWIKVKWWDRPRKKWRMGWTGPRYIKITGPATKAAPKAAPKKEEFDLDKGLDLVMDDGIENMTNVRIFVRNLYSDGYDKYVQIFEGNITSKSISGSASDWSLSFQCQDYMNWFSRTICAVAVPFDNTLTPGDRLRWKAQGIDLDNVQKFNSVKDITFKGKTLSQTWQTLSDQTMKSNKLFSDSSTVASWDDSLSRVVVMGDIDEKLRKAEIMDFLLTSSITQVNSVYVLLNDVLKSLMFEFYQDREGTVRIKPPFWNEHVLNNFIIDPSHLLSYTESSNFNQMYTRVISSGALDEWHENNTSSNSAETVKSLITPVVAITSGGVAANSGPVVVTSSTGGSSSSGNNSSGSIASKAVSISQQYIGWPYVWGGAKPSSGGFDCSGLIDYAYKQAGYQGFGSRETTYTLVNKGTAVSSKNDVLPGDIILPHADHVYMVVDSSRVIHAPRKGSNIEYKSLSSCKAWKIRRIVHGSGGGSSSVDNPKPVKPDEVGPDILLKPTYLEKKYGPLVYECSQPLIKFSTSGATKSDSAYDALTKYSRFMISYLNSSVSMATVHVNAMPWLRPGFNIWVDPINIDKVYYISSISHYGNAAGNYSNLTLSFGRKRTTFCSDKDKLGSLKPGMSDDIFVNKLMVTPSNFGKVCDYNTIKKKFDEHYKSPGGQSDNMLLTKGNTFLRNLYKDVMEGTKYANTVKPGVSAASKKVTGTVKVNSALNVRSGPGTNYGIKGALYNGNQVTINKEQKGWYNIDFKGSNAWVSSQYVKKNSTSPSGGGSGNEGTVKVNSALNVRSGPGTNYGIKGSLYNGNKVKIHKEQSGWLNIDFKGSTAWVSGKYVSRSASAPAEIKNKSYDSVYASHANKSFFPAQYTIKDIQEKLNTEYNKANSVVKERKNRLASLVTHSTNIMQNGMYTGDYMDKPFSSSKGRN